MLSLFGVVGISGCNAGVVLEVAGVVLEVAGVGRSGSVSKRTRLCSGDVGCGRGCFDACRGGDTQSSLIGSRGPVELVPGSLLSMSSSSSPSPLCFFRTGESRCGASCVCAGSCSGVVVVGAVGVAIGKIGSTGVVAGVVGSCSAAVGVAGVVGSVCGCSIVRGCRRSPVVSIAGIVEFGSGNVVDPREGFLSPGGPGGPGGCEGSVGSSSGRCAVVRGSS